jgi:hypothetical protein
VGSGSSESPGLSGLSNFFRVPEAEAMVELSVAWPEGGEPIVLSMGR